MESNKNFFDSLKEDWEKDLLFSKEENKKQLELQKKELEEENRKKWEKIEKEQKKSNEERWQKIEKKLKIIYWLIGISFLFSVVFLILFLIKGKS
ncbi:MAG: hypothetical protein I3273_06865 [Candidatus Moeniiplasma glomeromycotorum]|nr:hypothetical protein [Candidatus Moeniiplasma glomeromycotorum]MCE8168162.1 hypothetical protein [Candidatus Moeniiplasma glomeromycotorum]MCE8169807.1 hypothetical protein [Candidatus Moeniiplasma glomeromycotorum]